MYARWLEALQSYLHRARFEIPLEINLGATFVFALTGALVAIRRGYDWVGVFALALVVGVGGGLLRDGILLQQGPPAAIRDSRYLFAVLAACLAAWLLASHIERFGRTIAILDALGLGAYAAVGMQMALDAGFHIGAAVLVGLVNACGGGLLRDVLVREEPLVFKPGQFYVLAALCGCLLYVTLTVLTPLTSTVSALVSIVVTFGVRLLAIHLNWQSTPVRDWVPEGSNASTSASPPVVPNPAPPPAP